MGILFIVSHFNGFFFFRNTKINLELVPVLEITNAVYANAIRLISVVFANAIRRV